MGYQEGDGNDEYDEGRRALAGTGVGEDQGDRAVRRFDCAAIRARRAECDKGRAAVLGDRGSAAADAVHVAGEVFWENTHRPAGAGDRCGRADGKASGEGKTGEPGGGSIKRDV